MIAQVKDELADRGRLSQVGKDETTLVELRKSVTEIANEVSKIAEKRGQAVKEAAQAGTLELRRSIRHQPVLAMGLAAAAGAILAIAVVPRANRERNASRWDGWVPSVSRADIYDVADSLQRSVSRAVNGVPVTSSLERLVEAVAKVDGNAGVTSALEKIGAWLQKAPASSVKK